MLKQHGSTRSSRLARHVECVESCRDKSKRDEPSGIWALLVSAGPKLYVLCTLDKAIAVAYYTQVVSYVAVRSLINRNLLKVRMHV